jgi:hypothetical protein
VNKYKEALEIMVWQFGHRVVSSGRLAIICGGLSALEEAFDALGWDSPHYINEPSMECDVKGCHNWRGAQIEWDGFYSCICDEHFKDYCAKKPRPLMKQAAITREASRDKYGCLPMPKRIDLC